MIGAWTIRKGNIKGWEMSGAAARTGKEINNKKKI